MLISNATLNSLRTGIKAQFTEGLAQISREMQWYLDLAEVVTSNDKLETYPITDRLPRLREWVGPRSVRNLIEHSYQLTNKTYELTYSISVNDLEDGKFHNLNTWLRDSGRQAGLWPNGLIYDALINGDVSVCYDGQFFFDTDHPLEVQGEAATTEANLHAGSALTPATYETVRLAMMSRKSSDGKPMGIMPTHLIVPAALEATGKRILETEMVGYLYNTNSTATDTNIWRGTAKLMVIPELDANSTTTWYLADLSKGFKPFMAQIRKRPDSPTIMNQPNDPNVFDDDEVKVGYKARGAGGYGLWQLIDQCNA